MRRTFLEIARRGFKLSSEIVIESLPELVGKEGTLIFQLFNFKFPTSKFFSLLTTPSQMGKITEDARMNYPGWRTGHHIYSFFVMGSNEQHFKDIDNVSGYGSDSPFAKISEIDGRIAVIDLDDQRSMTHFHHVEEMCNVKYRFHKDFEGKYADLEGTLLDKKSSLFLRDLQHGVLTDVNRVGEILRKEDLYKGNRPGIDNGLRGISSKVLFERTRREILESRALQTFYSIDTHKSGSK